MRYEITGRGGRYPGGCSFLAPTAGQALALFREVEAACGVARAYGPHGRGLSVEELIRLAEAERSPS